MSTAVGGSAGATTAFWIDPAEELIVIFLIQLIPSQTFKRSGQLKSIIYPAIIG
jgi:CubicO group peptidase (beta-lactamase class C family)